MVNIVSRSGWNARAGRGFSRTTWGSRTGFTTHYSAGPTSQTVRQIQNFHLDGRGWSDIAYNFLVDDEGTAFEGRGWLGVGAHAAPHNTSHIGVCFIGRDGDATPAAKNTIRALYDEANSRAGRTLSQTYHRGLSGQSTDCPGSDLASWVDNGMPADGAGTGEGYYMFGLRHGDQNERVEGLQTALRHAGFADLLGNFGPRGDGVDGHYGDSTEDAVLAARRYVGSGATNGKRVSAIAVEQIYRARARREAERAVRALES